MEVEKIKHKSDSKGTKDKIIELFFEKHLRPVDISKKLKVKMPYITKIIQMDLRYNKEKETRRQDNKEKQKTQKRIYAQNKREKERQEKQAYQKLLIQINNDNKFLSTKKKTDDIKDTRWLRSAYDYDKNTSDLLLKDEIRTGYNVAKRVSNIVNPDMIKSKRIFVQLVCFDLSRCIFLLKLEKREIK